jgi:predicted RNase H-like nuclease (RuvC/YqgF family)
MPFLAQASPPPEALASWLQVFMYLVLSGTAIVVAYRTFTGKARPTELTGQPLEVKAHAGSVSRDELKQVHGRIERERGEINREIKRVEDAAEKRSDALEENLRMNTAMTAEMRGEVRQMNQQMQTLNGTLSDFLRDAAKK